MVIYRTFSFRAMFRVLLFRVVLICAAGGALFHFDENPVVISIFVAALFIGFLVVGSDHIVVYPDRFVFQQGSWLKQIFPEKVYYYKDLKSVTCSGTIPDFIDPLGDSDHRHHHPKKYNRLTIVFRNGSEKSFTTGIYKNHLLAAVKTIQQQMRAATKQKACTVQTDGAESPLGFR